MMRMTKYLLAGLLCCAYTSTPAWADDPLRANVLADSAAARVQQGELRFAIDLYEEAYAAAPRSTYLRELARLYDQLAQTGGDPRDIRLALDYYEKYLHATIPAPDSAELELRMANLRMQKAATRSTPAPAAAPVHTESTAGQPAPLHLLAYEGENRYSVRIGDQECTTPCTLAVPPGSTMLRATGSGDLSLQLAIPDHPAQIRLQHREGRGFTAGAVLLPTGILVGTSMWALGLACYRDAGCEITNMALWPIVGVGMTIAGIVLLARGRGIPPVDANRIELTVASRLPRLRLASIGAAPTKDGVGGGLSFQF